jgi:hypothetical protein
MFLHVSDAVVSCQLNTDLNDIQVSTDSVTAGSSAIIQCLSAPGDFRFIDGTDIKLHKCVAVNGVGKLTGEQSDCACKYKLGYRVCNFCQNNFSRCWVSLVTFLHGDECRIRHNARVLC